MFDISPFATGNTLLTAIDLTKHVVPSKHAFKIF